MDDHTHIAMDWKDQNPGPKINHRDGITIGGGRWASRSGPTSLRGGPSAATHGVHGVTELFLLALTLVLHDLAAHGVHGVTKSFLLAGTLVLHGIGDYTDSVNDAAETWYCWWRPPRHQAHGRLEELYRWPPLPVASHMWF